MKTLLIDNYDSFTFNLEHRLLLLGLAVTVRRNDEITVPEVAAAGYELLVISPGPSSPAHAGISVELVRHFYDKVPLLGICLGNQCIAAAFGYDVRVGPLIMHGKTSQVTHNGQSIFTGIQSPLPVMRYHSLIVDGGALERDFRVTSWVVEGGVRVPMSIAHRQYPVVGMQFHPESVFTTDGSRLLSNFIASLQCSAT